MDDLGRIVIPSDMREELGWGTGQKLEVVMNDIAAKTVVVREISLRCSLCREQTENLRGVEKGHVCPKCAVKIRA